MEHPRPDDREHFERHRRQLMAYDQDGSLYWSIPEGTETTTGPIVRAEIIPPDTSQQADQI